MRRRPRRYVARELDWRFIGVKTGVVDDTRPDEPSCFEHVGPGFEFVTTFSNAKRIARRANRLDGRRRR